MNQDQEQSGEHLIPENSYYHPLIAFWMPQRFALKAITQFKMRNSTFKSTARLWGLKMPVAMPIQPQAKQTARLNIMALSGPPQWQRYRDDIFDKQPYIAILFSLLDNVKPLTGNTTMTALFRSNRFAPFVPFESERAWVSRWRNETWCGYRKVLSQKYMFCRCEDYSACDGDI